MENSKIQLVVLDYSLQEVEVHIYRIDSDIEVDESYIKNLGHDVYFCTWSFGNEVKIISHLDT